ncbi:regulatory protein, luxR family [Saccharopolyspora kobensis]|uniref:Regulatory protein, luxR family n=2 Tax=Saccharopolyspora kobensis TaxID=146035 RepID=A0A1H6EFP5_9PSEU|nr:LuxR family transcriptional regulator [Saccharopolyspora kobensis]SEG96627.1 regulatory protein, luxR family [Saccharopolyspora kobensis]SFF05313.1 regulatory protein, luxR family [Saccharopolyspora kobensis]
MARTPRPARTQIRTSSPVLVGRAEQLASLQALAALHPAVALIEGEAGVGKSRLIREVLAGDLGPTTPLVGHCRQVGEPFPYGAVLEALRSARPGPTALSPVTGVLGPLLPEIAEHLPAPPEPLGDPRAERHRLFRAVRELLSSLGPLLLVIEDLQWADDGTRQLLRFLMGDPPANLTTAVTYRREDVPGGLPLGVAYRPPNGVVSVVLPLDPLGVDDVRALTAAILGEDRVSAQFAARLHERTAGIPFVVEETLRALRNRGGAVRTDGAAARRLLDTVEVPVLLRDAMAERLAALPTAATRLVKAAAVLGVPVTAELLGAVAGVPEPRLRTALTHALSGHVLHEQDGGTYGFRHSLAMQAVYDTIGGPDRVYLHTRAIDVLDRVEPKPLHQLADHSERAGRVADWLSYGEAAADRAAALGDAATTTALLQRLLKEQSLPAEHVDRLAIKLGKIAHTGLDQRDPSETLEGLLNDQRLSTSARGEVRLYLGLLLLRQAGGLATARAEIERALNDLSARPDLAARGASVLALAYVGQTSLAELRPWQARLTEYRQGASGELRLSLLANEFCSRMHVGDPTVLSSLDELPDEVTTVGEQHHLARLRSNLGDACAWTGHLRLAGELLREGVRLATACGATFVVSTARSTQARLDWFTGEWSGLAERSARMLDEYRDLFPVTSELSLVLGSLAVTRGEWAAATSHFTETGAFALEEAISPVGIAGCAGLAWNLLSQDEPARACADVDRGLDFLRRKGVWAWIGELGPVAVAVYLAAGREADAERLVAEMADRIAGLDVPIAVAALTQCRGRLAEHRGDLAEAVAHYRAATERYEELPAPYYAATVAERAATCLLTTDHAAATGELSHLVDVFDQLGATRDAARCRHLLRGAGGGKPSRRGRRGYGDELSPREEEVARLLASGHTNREIAEILFLSPRTVEQHAARVLRKLGVRSRTQLRL